MHAERPTWAVASISSLRRPENCPPVPPIAGGEPAERVGGQTGNPRFAGGDRLNRAASLSGAFRAEGLQYRRLQSRQSCHSHTARANTARNRMAACNDRSSHATASGLRLRSTRRTAAVHHNQPPLCRGCRVARSDTNIGVRVRFNGMSARLHAKTALVTGAAGGIGSAIVRRFVAEGAAVVANDIASATWSSLDGVVGEGRGKVTAHVADHSREQEVAAMMARVRAEHGALDILVNNAFAAYDDCAISELAEPDWDRTLAACLKGPFLCTKHAIPLMQEGDGGSIVTVSSVNALRAVSETAYTAAKGGLVSMMRLVAADYAQWNIRSNVICPGTVATSASMDYWEKFPTGFEALRRMYPLGRIGEPEDIADYVLFLASDESRWVTGTVHVVDGGLMGGTKLEVV